MPNSVTPQHAAEHGQPQGPPPLGTGPGGDHQRHDAEDEGERRHQDRPQPQPHRLQRRPPSLHARLHVLGGD
jgi:hypothetical protein